MDRSFQTSLTSDEGRPLGTNHVANEDERFEKGIGSPILTPACKPRRKATISSLFDQHTKQFHVERVVFFIRRISARIIISVERRIEEA